MKPTLLAPLLGLLAPFASAQLTLVAPNGYQNVEGNSNQSIPWGQTTGNARSQFLYDSATFTGQGVSTPIRISRLRFRADAIANTWTGGSRPQMQIDLSTCPVDFTQIGNNFNGNHGADRTTVLNGPMTVLPGQGGNQPGPWYIDIPLTTTFVYDPTSGADLCMDLLLTGAGWTGQTAAFDAVSGVGTVPPPLGSRVYDTTTGSPNNATGTVGMHYAAVCEFTYAPTSGLWPAFTATPPGGPAPLTVQFTDQSLSSDPAGVIAWQWDLDGDNAIDSTLQHPTFTYAACGSYTVTLTAIDAVHGPVTVSRPNFIVTDQVAPDFTWSVQPANIILFTDTTTPPATSWAWDFDGDGLTDSTAQNPAWIYPGCLAAHVRLTASRACGPAATVRRSIPLAPNSLTTLLTGGAGLLGGTSVGPGNLFDLQVVNPSGVKICALTVCPYSGAMAIGTPIGCEVWITDAPGGYAGNHTNAAVWRKAATGSGFFDGGNSGRPRPVTMTLDRSIYLPMGSYGVAVHMVGVGIAYGTANLTRTNADLVLTAGAAKSTPFNAAITNSRVWHGTLHYDTAQTGGTAGFGYFGPGCSGTLGISSQSYASLPQLGGTFAVTVNRLPIDSMFHVLGLSRSVSTFGPLPLDLGGFGAPGCSMRVSADAVTFVVGQGGLGTWSVPLPANQALAGMVLYSQPLVLDPSVNAMGAVVGDACGILIGL